MARWIHPSHDHIDAVLAAADAWRERCFMADGSMFGDENLWTLDNIRELERCVMGGWTEAKGRFIDKFEDQLKSAPSRIVRLGAEVLWLLYLFPHESAMKPDTKRRRIKRIWEVSSRSLPDSNYLNDRALKGVADPGKAYRIYRDQELRFLFQVMKRWKSDHRQARLMANGAHWRFVTWIDEIDGSDRYQMRNMMLYLLFPDYLERIVSISIKQEIFEKFNHWLPRESRFEAPIAFVDLDKSLYGLRKILAKKYGNKIDFDFSPLEEIWKQD